MHRFFRVLSTVLFLFYAHSALAQDVFKAREAQERATRSETTSQASITGALTPCVNGNAGGFACNNVDLLAMLTSSDIGGGASVDLNDIWGWTDPVTGVEYALVGLENGTSFVDLSDPQNPVYVGKLPTHSSSSLWRDIKVYNDHAFIVSEASSHGMQVFDLNQLRDVTNPPVTFTETAHFPGVGNAHNIVINEDTGFAYIVGSTFGGTNLCGGGLYMVNIQDPVNPTFAGCFGGDGYTHDAQCIVYNGPDTQHVGDEICFAANEDTITIVDVTDKANPVMLSRTGYTQTGYTHQGWVTEDHRYFLLDDELDESFFGLNTTTRIWDVSDLEDPVIQTIYTSSVGSIDHNQYVMGDHTYQSNYTSGLRILNIADVNNPFEAGFFDTYSPSNSKSFVGTWSNYPYFSSGVVVVSDITVGLFVLQPNLDGTPPPPDLAITLTPESNNIIIPGGGGSFQYDLTATNNSAVSQTVDLWLVIDGPGVSRTFGPVTKTLAAGGSLTRTMTQNIPAGAPAGSYTLTGNIGSFPTAEASDSFPFEKSAAKGGDANVTDWSTSLDARAGAGSNPAQVPAAFTLDQNYPNPFNPTTTIRYTLAEESPVTLTIYNQLGQRIRTLVSGRRPAGTHTLEWDATNDAGARVPSGLYVYRLEAGGVTLTRSMTLLK
ncbi:choice-of-anchor B family protein [Rhodocaloribacter sp.]